MTEDDPWCGWNGEMPDAPAPGERVEAPGYWRGWDDGFAIGMRSGAGVMLVRAQQALSAIGLDNIGRQPKPEERRL